MNLITEYDWDMGDPMCAGVLLGAIVIAMVAAIRMDMRKLPLGRVKYVPWTMITLVLLFAALFTSKILILDVMAA